jgi:hypothetical protein
VIRSGDHVKVLAEKPDGSAHPHAGKTVIVDELLMFGNPRAMIKVDAGAEPQGFICVSLQCLERVE